MCFLLKSVERTVANLDVLSADVFSKLHCLPDHEPSPTEPDHYSTFAELYG